MNQSTYMYLIISLETLKVITRYEDRSLRGNDKVCILTSSGKYFLLLARDTNVSFKNIESEEEEFKLELPEFNENEEQSKKEITIRSYCLFNYKQKRILGVVSNIRNMYFFDVDKKTLDFSLVEKDFIDYTVKPNYSSYFIYTQYFKTNATLHVEQKGKNSIHHQSFFIMSDDKYLKFWDLDKRSFHGEIGLEKARICEFYINGAKLLATCTEESLTFIDVCKLEKIKQVSVMPKTRYLTPIIIRKKNFLTIWDFEDKYEKIMKHSETKITCLTLVKLNEAKTYLASCASDSRIVVWNQSTLEKLYEFSCGDDKWVMVVVGVYLPVGENENIPLLASGDGYGGIVLWNLNDQTKYCEFQEDNAIHCFYYHPLMLTFDISTEGSQEEGKQTNSKELKDNLEDIKEESNIIHFEDCRCLISGNESGIITIFDLIRKIKLKNLQGHRGRVIAFESFEKSGVSFLVSVSHDHQIIFWNLNDSSVYHKFEDPSKSWIHSITKYETGGKIFLITCNLKLEISLWDVDANSKITSLAKEHYSKIKKLLTVKIGSTNYLLSGSEDESIVIWDIAKRKPVYRLEDHTSAISCILTTWINRQQYIITSSHNGLIMLFKI